ncbi:uncharacterized protein [Lepisosteus oculatus]|uniref:uncharacterized protein isoform X2 n=1 Tax=Lepisosteus oculatus TaxID=7918 RepID=UPI00073FB260|nr:PREDICTED: uncharacterized protein LOC107079485 isoform X2 [Lepisosteus oculatus]
MGFQERRVLVEIPAPQPKITAHIRRSYFEALNYRMGSSPYKNKSLATEERGLSGAVKSCIKKQKLNQKKELQLMAFSREQLVNLVSSLMLLEEERSPPASRPDLKLLKENLQLKKTHVYRSIPYSRLGSNRDAHCYRKAYPHLVAFKKTCLEGGRLLLQSEMWEAAVEYGLAAWRFTSELPQWDTSSHNGLREQCYRTLAAQCSAALQHSGLGMAKCLELRRRFKIAWTQSKLIMPCIQDLERRIENLQCTMTES